MTRRQLVTTLLLGVLAQITLLGVFVFIDEPERVGGPAPHFHLADLAYLAVPLLLMASAAVMPVRMLVRQWRRDRSAYRPGGNG